MSPHAIAYWEEFRQKIFVFVFFFFMSFAVAYVYSSPIYQALSQPLKTLFGSGLVAFSLTDVFLPPLQLAWNVAWLVSVPVLLRQIYAFFAPALYGHEKRMVRTSLLMSIALFYAGFFGAMYFIPTILLSNVQSQLPENVQYVPNIRLYTDFMLQLSFAFGLFFELPLVMLLLNVFQLLTLSTLLALRRYFLIFSFVLGMLLTPPDVLSQCVVAIPLCVIFELGLCFCRLYQRFYAPQQLTTVQPA